MDKRQLIILIIAILLAVGFRVVRKYMAGKGESGKSGDTNKPGKINSEEDDDYEPYSGK